jgi:hypothetical protein
MAKWINIFMVMLFSLLVLGACAKPVDIADHAAKAPERILERNYRINQVQHAYVGEEIIRAKDYWVGHGKSRVKSSNNFTLQHPSASHTGTRGDTFEIIGTTMDGDRKLYLIKFPNIEYLSFGITQDGALAKFVVDDARERQGAIMSLTPEDTKFELVKESGIDISRGFLHYEMTFNGITGDAVKLTYREFAPEDPFRPASIQNLVYPIDADIIRFRHLRMKMHEVNSESISFTVLEDGISGW